MSEATSESPPRATAAVPGRRHRPTRPVPATGPPAPAGRDPRRGDRPDRSRCAARAVRHAQRSTPACSSRCCTIRANHPKADLAMIERAYAVAEKAHRGQMRKSGDPYITHPVAVATILAELGMTAPTLAAALLHDTVEDTEYTLDAAAQGLRRRGRDAGRRRHQARQGELRRRGAGRDRPQDGRGDGPRHPRAGHQAGRPPAQRPHLEVRPAGVGRAQGARDARDLRARWRTGWA